MPVYSMSTSNSISSKHRKQQSSSAEIKKNLKFLPPLHIQDHLNISLNTNPDYPSKYSTSQSLTERTASQNNYGKDSVDHVGDHHARTVPATPSSSRYQLAPLQARKLPSNIHPSAPWNTFKFGASSSSSRLSTTNQIRQAESKSPSATSYNEVFSYNVLVNRLRSHRSALWKPSQQLSEFRDDEIDGLIDSAGGIRFMLTALVKILELNKKFSDLEEMREFVIELRFQGYLNTPKNGLPSLSYNGSPLRLASGQNSLSGSPTDLPYVAPMSLNKYTQILQSLAKSRITTVNVDPMPHFSDDGNASTLTSVELIPFGKSYLRTDESNNISNNLFITEDADEPAETTGANTETVDSVVYIDEQKCSLLLDEDDNQHEEESEEQIEDRLASAEEPIEGHELQPYEQFGKYEESADLDDEVMQDVSNVHDVHDSLYHNDTQEFIIENPEEGESSAEKIEDVGSIEHNQELVIETPEVGESADKEVEDIGPIEHNRELIIETPEEGENAEEETKDHDPIEQNQPLEERLDHTSVGNGSEEHDDGILQENQLDYIEDNLNTTNDYEVLEKDLHTVEEPTVAIDEFLPSDHPEELPTRDGEEGTDFNLHYADPNDDRDFVPNEILDPRLSELSYPAEDSYRSNEDQENFDDNRNEDAAYAHDPIADVSTLMSSLTIGEPVVEGLTPSSQLSIPETLVPTVYPTDLNTDNSEIHGNNTSINSTEEPEHNFSLCESEVPDYPKSIASGDEGDDEFEPSIVEEPYSQPEEQLEIPRNTQGLESPLPRFSRERKGLQIHMSDAAPALLASIQSNSSLNQTIN